MTESISYRKCISSPACGIRLVLEKVRSFLASYTAIDSYGNLAKFNDHFFDDPKNNDGFLRSPGFRFTSDDMLGHGSLRLG